MKNIKRLTAAVFAASFGLAGAAYGAPPPGGMYPGTTNPTSGFSITEQESGAPGIQSLNGATFVTGTLAPGPAGNTGADLQWQVSGFSATSGTKTIAGNLWSAVLTGDSNNPWGTSGYDWVYQVILNTSNNTEVETVTINNWDFLLSGSLDFDGAGPFGTTNTAVGYLRIPVAGGFGGAETCGDLTGCSLPGVVAPGPRNPISASRNGAGDNITFGFNTAIGLELNGTRRSPFLIVYTGANLIALGGHSVSDGATADNISGFSPSPIPEPETYAMMLAGLGLMGFVARRRKGMKTA